MKRMIELEDVLHNLKLMTNVCNNNHWGPYLWYSNNKFIETRFMTLG
jgi:parallel beta-helix repeat protein